jgi:hypothetical protein
MSDYAKWGKAYYQAHRAEILAAEKDKKRWLEYYEKNKEAIAERNRQRYYEKKGLPVPEKGAARERKGGRPPAPNKEFIERFEKLVSEMRELAPQVMRRKKKVKAPVPLLPASPVSEAEPVNSVELNPEPPRLTVDEGEIPAPV